MGDLEIALRKLRDGNLVAFPSETVYGLGADASNESAIAKVFAVKNRPTDHPVIVHLPNANHIERWARNVPERAFKLAQYFWPGPLTIILPKAPDVSSLITAGKDTIALRVPQHQLTLELLDKFDGAIVGPSANKFGQVSPTAAQHVQLDDVFVLDGGLCSVGIESTIVACIAKEIVLLRPGMVSKEEIEDCLQTKIADNNKLNIKAPGSLASHYAPKAKLYLTSSAKLPQLVQELSKHSCGVLSFQEVTQSMWLQAHCDPAEYARELYSNMRKLDHNDIIIVEMPPRTAKWCAIHDRLQRASYKEIV